MITDERKVFLSHKEIFKSMSEWNVFVSDINIHVD